MLETLRKSFLLNRPHLVGDAWGGLAAMLVALPAAIAFGVTIFAPLGGSLAAHGALAGILGATVLGLIAPACGGTSRLITAPCAPAAAVLAALAVGFSQQGAPAATIILLLALIGLLAGVMQISLGVAGIGRLIRYIPYPVVSGYLSGVGLIIIGSQIPKLLGAPTGTSLLGALGNPSLWAWQGIVVGAVVIFTMLQIPRLTQLVPAAILALLAGVAAYLLLGLLDPTLLDTANNPLLIGVLTSSEASLGDSIGRHLQALRGLGLAVVLQVLVPALTLALLLSIDTLKTCVVLDALTNTHHDSNRELIGQGLGNTASALVGGIPGAGTMGASLINVSSGGTTRASGLMTGGFSLAAFLLLAPLIAWIPVAALAAILIVIGFRMIDRHSLAFFNTPSTRVDFFVILAVVLVAIFGNLIAASGVGVALAMLLFIREQTRSSVVRNRIEGSEILQKRARTPAAREKLAQESSAMVVFELQGSLFFGTANQLLAALEPEIGQRKYIILNMRRVQSLDVTATHVLEQIKDRLEENNASLVFCEIPKDLPSGLKMKRFLKETGVVRPTNKAFAFRQLDEALDWVEAQTLAATPDQFGNGDAASTLDLTAMPAFAQCSPESIAALEAATTLRTIPAGKRVFKAGNPGNELFIIRSGRIKLLLPIRKKETYHLATCGPGDMVGGRGFLDDNTHSAHTADALALTAVEVYVLPHERFDALADAHRGVAIAILKNLGSTLAHRLRVTITELQALRG
ncbi:MAG: SulP family inorganic anion transporter [Rhodocyclaceae bacterium]|nr:SulP family inorganic anion transporter [Rhodocyclaceae bacterium]